ncbi:PrgI family protein [Candidatus Giovannonibacteria bacterium]|nr:PrgI family protein [Candidatus Giovannonibacteria bacterium]
MHQVPQFIEVEDKIFGPLTIKQFFYILGGGALVFIFYIFLQIWAVILLGTPVMAFFGALAFYKINGIPFTTVLGNALSFFQSKKIFLWKKRPLPPEKAAERAKQPINLRSPQLSESKLQDLAWSLDIQKHIKR